MPLVATYLYGGAASMPAGVGCFATGVTPACLTAALYQEIGAHCFPVLLVSRSGATAIFANCNGAGVNGEMLAFFAHSIIS